MYPRLGYARVWAKLTAGLAGLDVPCPSEKALRDLCRRLGPAPLKALFEVVAGPLAQPRTPGVRFGGLRTVAFDGCNSVKVPDTSRNRCWLGRIRYRMGFAGYPTLRLMTLAETGTRGLPGAVLGSADDRDEATVARRLLPLLHPGMLILLDRAFDANAFLREVAATGAVLLARAKSTRHPPVLGHLPDGSYLSHLDGLKVRIIEASVTMTGADGSRIRDSYRLITTLMDHRKDQLTAAQGICPDGPGRPARRDRPGRAGHAATRPPPPVQRPQGQMRHLPVPQPRRRPPGPPRHHHRDRHHHQHPAPRPQARPDPPRAEHPGPPPPARPAHSPGADHRHHHQPPPTRLERPRTRRPPRRQTPQHAHPARRMGTPGLLHPHRLRHLQTQHTARRHLRCPEPSGQSIH